MNEEEVKNIALATNGIYLNGSSTKQVVDEFKKELDEIEKKEYETQKVADYKDQFQWFLALAFLVLFLDIFVLERKTPWIKRLNLFNEKES
jgi:Ca-activated chloride channel family protein